MLTNPVHCLPAALFTCVLLSATAASLHAETAYSTPCGYIQTNLNAKATGYLGLGVHPEALMQHTLEPENVTVSGSKITITDPDVNFTELMETDSAYVLELIFGDEAMALPLNRDAWKSPLPAGQPTASRWMIKARPTWLKTASRFPTCCARRAP